MKLLQKLFAAAGLATAFGSANAVSPDMTAITAAVDVTTVLAAIAAVAVIKFTVPFTRWAYAKVAGLFGR